MLPFAWNALLSFIEQELLTPETPEIVCGSCPHPEEDGVGWVRGPSPVQPPLPAPLDVVMARHRLFSPVNVDVFAIYCQYLAESLGAQSKVLSK